MAAIGDLIGICLAVFLVVAGLSLTITKVPATPSFARRAAASGAVQLRQDHNAGFILDRGFLFRRRSWFVGTCCPPVRIGRDRYRQLGVAQPGQPVRVAQSGGRVWWWFEADFYWESGGYTARDVLALIRDRQRRSAQRLDRAHMLLNADEGTVPRPRGRREAIPREMRRAIFERDGGTCAQCGDNFDLQYDHVIPVALGGATTLANLQLLCSGCNRRKGADL